MFPTNSNPPNPTQSHHNPTHSDKPPPAMSRPKSKNSLLAGHSLSASLHTAKDDILQMKYTMDKPGAAIYPLQDKTADRTYPDFTPWAENDAKNAKLQNSNFLNNGYFEGPLVLNEYYSARNLVQETLFLSTQNCTKILNELLLNLAKAYRTRNEVINKIYAASNNFKLPPRVTLTAQKKDAWLRDLANPDVPLRHVATKLPHGIRNKVLVDCMCTMNVPIARALWFTKCVLYSEQILLRKKFALRLATLAVSHASPSLDYIEGRWLQEWTLQVADYVLKFSRDMNKVATDDKRVAYMAKLRYLVQFVQALYLELLLDRTFFLSTIISFLRADMPFTAEHLPELLNVAKVEVGESNPALDALLLRGPLNYGQILCVQTLVTIFWNDIVQEDFLCKLLSESLLLVYFLVERVPTKSSDLLLSLKQELLASLLASVLALFQHNSNTFILPTFWLIIGEVLYRILMKSSSAKQQDELEDIIRFINFRNESLMLNMRYVSPEANTWKPDELSAGRRSSFLLSGVKAGKVLSKMPVVSEPDLTSMNRSTEDNLRFIEQLDKMKLKSGMVKLVRPKPAAASNSMGWRVKVKVMIYWCVSAFRDMGVSSEKILIVANFLKKNILQPMTGRGSALLKAEFESQILESIFSLAHEPRETIRMKNVFVLINELYQLKVVSISSYLRKIIACGIFYVSSMQHEKKQESDPQILFHLAVLVNLPASNNKQYYHILKTWTTSYADSAVNYENGVELARIHILNGLELGHFTENYEPFLQTVSKFEIGVKFLLTNWVTSQIRTAISNSPKLIHMTPEMVMRLYRFYCCADNLTVFFKVFVKYVLKNENKIIIYYLNTLHLISTLVQHHYPLVKAIAGNSYDASSTAYELFNLIVISYKDLLSRETDFCKFEGIWKFMKKSVEKTYNDSGSNFSAVGKRSQFGKLVFNKDTAESPLKVPGPNTRGRETFSGEDFSASLDELLKNKNTMIFNDELFSELEVLDLDYANLGLTSKTVSNAALEIVLTDWFRLAQTSSEQQDRAFATIAEMARKHLKTVSDKSLYRTVHSTVSKMITLGDEGQFTQFLAKLLSYGVFLHSELIFMLDEFIQESHDTFLNEVIFEITFGHDSMTSLTETQLLYLEIAQCQYQADFAEDLFRRILECLALSARIENSFLVERFGEKTFSHLFNVLLTYRTWAIKMFTEKLPSESISYICGRLALISIPDTLAELPQLAPVANIFSLHVLQLVLKVKTSTEEASNESFGDVMLRFLDHCRFPFDQYNSFFGELFLYVDSKYVTELFHFLEDYVMTQSKTLPLPEAKADNIPPTTFVELRTGPDGIDLLPPIKDFFKKFSMSCVTIPALPMEMFRKLSQQLQLLLHFLENDVVILHGCRNVYDVVSIFLRLLIIHNSSITEIISKTDNIQFEFLRNLVALINTRYFAQGHEKLKILLYDLLLLMKSLLSHLLTVNASEEILVRQSASANAEQSPMPGPNADAPHFAGATSAISTMTDILTLPGPTMQEFKFEEEMTDSPLTLETDELYYGSEISRINDGRLTIVSKDDAVTLSPFNAPTEKPSRPFAMSSMKLIADTSEGLNNGCISLSMFDAYTTRENPY